MNEILSKIDNLKERINKKEDKKEILEEINNINELIKNSNINKEFRDLLILYQNAYDECLFNCVVGDDKE